MAKPYANAGFVRVKRGPQDGIDHFVWQARRTSANPLWYLEDLRHAAQCFLKAEKLPYKRSAYEVHKDGSFTPLTNEISPDAPIVGTICSLSKLIERRCGERTASHYAAQIVDCINSIREHRRNSNIDSAMWQTHKLTNLWWMFYAEVHIRQGYETSERQKNVARQNRRSAAKKSKSSYAAIAAAADNIRARNSMLSDSDLAERLVAQKHTAVGKRKPATIRRILNKYGIHDRE